MKPTDDGAPRPLRRMMAMLLLAACLGPAAAQEAGIAAAAADAPAPAIHERYPPGSITSQAQAEQALQDLRQARARLDGVLETSQRACHDHFFMTACLLDAKEQHRVALQKLKVIEVEANTYKRQARVDARDSALAARTAAQDGESDSRPEALRASLPLPPEAVKPEAAGVRAEDPDTSAVVANNAVKSAQERRRKALAHRNKVAKAQARQREVAAKKAAATPQ